MLADYVQRVEGHPHASGGYRTKGNVVERSNFPLVSIVTVTFNAVGTLPQTLQSVREQTYPNIEHIIIDGGSVDGTLELIKACEDTIALWRSEPDQGIYDAFNKGIALAQGEFVGILNADDYYEPDQIAKAVAALVRTNAQFVHGNIVMHGWKGQDVPLRGDPDYASKICYGMPMLFQVTVLCRMEIFRRYGLFLTRYRIAGDYEWFLRLAKQGCVGAYDPRIRAHMQAGGVSTTQQRRSLWEAVLIIWRNGVSLPKAIWVTLPRLVFPNGMPRPISRMVYVISNPAAALSRLANYAAKRKEARQNKRPHHSETQVLLAAFLDARQVCSTISPLGLEWLFGLALRCSSFAVQASSCAEVSAAISLLSGGGVQQIADANTAHILLVDRQHLDCLNIQHKTRRQTILLMCNGQITPDMRQLPHLDFGGFVAFGPHLDSHYSSKRG